MTNDSDATGQPSEALCKATEDAVQEGSDLNLTHTQTECLKRALEMLDRGHSGRFEDELWLGFGNDWWPFRERLLKTGYIRQVGGLRDELTITERGEVLLSQLSGQIRVAG